MRGGRRGFASVSVLFLSILVACGGDRGAGAPAGDSAQTAAPSDTARSVSPDTTAAAIAGRSDTAAAAAKPGAVARGTPPKTAPAPREPAAPAEPKPAAPAPAEADAPLRDPYHQAPRDTVSPQVYDGWKQYNLNCARCHGEDVQATTIALPLLMSVRPDGAIPTKELFLQTVCAGRPEKGMPAWCLIGMEMGKIEAIYHYVKGRSEGKIGLGRPAVRQ